MAECKPCTERGRNKDGEGDPKASMDKFRLLASRLLRVPRSEVTAAEKRLHGKRVLKKEK
jgi:hypothetical protein